MYACMSIFLTVHKITTRLCVDSPFFVSFVSTMLRNLVVMTSCRQFENFIHLGCCRPVLMPNITIENLQEESPRREFTKGDFYIKSKTTCCRLKK